MSKIKMGIGKGLFMPEVTVEMFRNASLEAVEDLLESGEVFDIDLKEELHREREQAYYNGYERGAEDMREFMRSKLATANLNCEKAYHEGYLQGKFEDEMDKVFGGIEAINPENSSESEE